MVFDGEVYDKPTKRVWRNGCLWICTITEMVHKSLYDLLSGEHFRTTNKSRGISFFREITKNLRGCGHLQAIPLRLLKLLRLLLISLIWNLNDVHNARISSRWKFWMLD
nr:unnamed protein product [Callosobruchus chinensis]